MSLPHKHVDLTLCPHCGEPARYAVMNLKVCVPFRLDDQNQVQLDFSDILRAPGKLKADSISLSCGGGHVWAEGLSLQALLVARVKMEDE